MGFPVGYTELILPKFLIQTLSILDLIRKIISALFLYLGLPDFIEPDIPFPFPDPLDAAPPRVPISAILIRELLPIKKISDISAPPEDCAVCLYEFQGNDEVRCLSNCRHVFHRNCLDRWMGYDQRTCPLCRMPIVPAEMQEIFNERLWAASAIPDFYGDLNFFEIEGL